MEFPEIWYDEAGAPNQAAGIWTRCSRCGASRNTQGNGMGLLGVLASHGTHLRFECPARADEKIFTPGDVMRVIDEWNWPRGCAKLGLHAGSPNIPTFTQAERRAFM